MSLLLLSPLSRLQSCIWKRRHIAPSAARRRRRPARTFSTFTSSVTSQSLTANGTLPYSALAIYEIITDIPSYSEFIPYITSSRVLEHSKPDAHYNRTWPQLATLKIGYGDMVNEEFVSQLLCVPPLPEKGAAGTGIVEAVSGSTIQAPTQIPPEQIAHHTNPYSHSKFSSLAGAGISAEDSPLEFLRTRWTFHPLPPQPSSGDSVAPQVTAKPQSNANSNLSTGITLSIEYRFRNRMYDMLVSAVAPKMAESMVRTFEQRVKSLLGGR